MTCCCRNVDNGPPRWRLAHTLVGMPKPLPPERYRETFEAFEAEHGVHELIAALRLAADYPPMQGWTADHRGRVVALLEAYERAVRRTAGAS